ncbi:MAG: DNA-binding NarL/FixJ family response regulator [Neolewinella sp.]|jgi:DNA-binding NarL/FixJ family response regulator
MPISVFNADDHPIIRKGITNLISEAPDLHWVGSAKDGQEALVKIRQLRPDVAVLDVEMPHLTGLEVATKLIEEGVPTNFILLTLFKEENLLRGAIAAGVKGYLLKESSEQEIVAGIRSAALGRVYVNAGLTHMLFGQAEEKDNPLDQLSDHERNILKLISREKTTAEIANMLFLSPKTIANHRNNISKKLGLSGEQNGLLKWAMSRKQELT